MTKYWRSIEEFKDPVTFKKSELMLDQTANRTARTQASRRDFLKLMGFSVATAAVVASCKKPVNKAIPFLVKPEEVVPGLANYYASTFFEGNEYCSVLVKVRDGRPIKIEGNNLSTISRQGTSARVQASVLNLYDDARLKSPTKKGVETTWEETSDYVGKKLAQLKSENKKVVLLTSTIISPSTKLVINQFLSVNPNIEWIQYDAISASGILKANELSFGKKFIPDYKFDKANVIVSFGADFLGTWLSPVEYTKAYSAGRKLLEPTDSMSRHYQFESGMTITGSNADVRFPIKPSEEIVLIAGLYNEILKAKGMPSVKVPATSVDLKSLAGELLDNEGKSLVVSGSNDVNVQLIVNAINNILGSYGSTIQTSTTLNTYQGIDSDFENLVVGLKNKDIAGLLCWGVNPVYNHPAGSEIKKAIEGLELSVALSDRPDETTEACYWVCPEPNYLEAWNDAEPKTGVYSLAQPTISKLFKGKPVQELLQKWSGLPEAEYYETIKKYWQENLFKQQTEFADSRVFWSNTLQRGTFEVPVTTSELTYNENGLIQAISSVQVNSSEGFELILYQSVAIGDGSMANNPWLHELPDPVAKISWDNFASVPVKWAEENGIKNESVIVINGLELPVFVQPGQATGTISVALGYGRQVAGKVGDGLGKNVFPLVKTENGSRKYWLPEVKVEITSKTYELALSQTHHSMEGRPIVRETTFEEWKKDQRAGNETIQELEENAHTLYPPMEEKSHHWGMAVDLTSCTGCSNCSVSCMAENNVPVVGKEQIRNRRIMHWIRIDRYYSNEAENPEVFHQPVMCQHCNNAPCENVCPVSATPHSSEGLNQVVYNRCVGTKYCMNNCPYKVRRFNWFQYVNNDEFDFASNSDLGRMVLNPDVTVRSRGVVEKCSFCVQRIQAAKSDARVAGRKVKDGEVQPACVQSCPADALVFGDMNDPGSRISKYLKNDRNYHVLSELHTLPSVGYLTKIRNKKA